MSLSYQEVAGEAGAAEAKALIDNWFTEEDSPITFEELADIGNTYVSCFVTAFHEVWIPYMAERLKKEVE